MTYSFIKAEGDVSVSSVKADEKTGKDVVVRLYNPTNKDTDAKLTVFKDVKEALYCNALEEPCGCTANVNGNEVTVPVKAGAYETLILKF